MIELKDGILLYHGSYTGISRIDLDKCTRGLDFGKGFYLTSSFEQAYAYVPLSVKKAVRLGVVPEDFNLEDGIISVYRFHYDPNLLIHSFLSANPEWLHFVSANRNQSLFPEYKLLPNRLQDQFCFRTEDAVKSLEFVRSDRYGDIKR